MNVSNMTWYDIGMSRNGLIKYQFSKETNNNSENVSGKRDTLVLSKESGKEIADSINNIWMKSIATGDPLKDEELAEHFADLGKRLDDAYARGEYSESEYNELNEALNKYMELTTDFVKRQRATIAIGAEQGSSPAKSYQHYVESLGKTPEQYQKDLQEKIKEYVDKFFKIDRDWLYDMVNRLRYGGSTLLK